MANKIIETTHDYEPVNRYIDEKARIKRTRSVWGYTRSLALFLIALGIFLILAAYAYHVFKKPHVSVRSDTSVFEDSEKQINQEIANKDDEIEKLENQLENNPDNENFKKQIESLEQEKQELEKKLSEQSNIHTNFTKFKWDYNAVINGETVAVATRYK